MVARVWRVRLSSPAELDFANILRWTDENFGERQAELYEQVLLQTIGELTNGPDIAGSRSRDEIMKDLRTLHVARHGRRGSHFLAYRATDERTIEVIRILHERMDLGRHLASSSE